MQDRTLITVPYDPVSKAWDALSVIYRRSGTDVQTFLLAIQDWLFSAKLKTEISHQAQESSPPKSNSSV